jgi:tape measure domain-containing protein
MEGGDQVVAEVDDRVVAMSFENDKFESGVSKTMSTLEKLKAALKFENASKGLTDLEDASNKVTLGHIASAVDSIKSKFTALKLVGIQVLGNIVTAAVSAGARLVKSLTLDPLTAGFKNYETQINAVQTILANTGLKGKKGLGQVNSALADLNTYANKTVYNFSEMARNIGTFTAAGVKLRPAVNAIKGIANLAALSGSNSQQASSAMYQLSQAIAAGQVHLQDWNSVVNAGMGGAVFQKALMRTGEAMGTISKGAYKVDKATGKATISGESFRQSIQSKPGQTSWLTSDVLTKTLAQFTGDLSDAQLKSEGFTKSQIKAIQAQAQVALHAATNIKTVTQLSQALKEEVATAWGAIFKTIFGDINQATSIFSKAHIVLENALTGPIYSLNKLLQDWSKLGGRDKAIDAIKNAFAALGSVMKPLGSAFREIFPPATGKELYNITVAIDNLFKKLTLGPKSSDELKRSFAGLFAILDIGKQLLGGIFTVLGKVFGAFLGGSGSILTVTGSLGDFLVSVDKSLKQGNRLHNFFSKLGDALAAPVKLLVRLKDVIIGLFAGFEPKMADGVSTALGDMGKKLSPMSKVMDGVDKAWQKFLGTLGKAGQILQPVVQSIANFFSDIGPAIAKAISTTNFSGVFEVIKVGLLGGIFVTLRKFLKGGILKGLGGGILGNISESFDALTGSLTALQTNIKAKTLQTIAIAVALLTASVVALSFIDAKKLNTAMSAMTIAFGQLLGAMAILTNISKSAGFIKLPFIAAGLVALSTAILILTGAVKNLSGLSWDQLAKGLGGVSVLLIGISRASGPLSKNSAGMISAGVGIAAIAVAMKILASAIADFGGMSFTEIGKGLGTIAAALVTIALASKLFPSGGMVSIGVGLIGVAAGLNLLAKAVAAFGNLDLSTIAKGIGAIAVSMGVIAVAMWAMPPGLPLMAAGLILVSVALKGIAKAVSDFGGMSIGELAKGLLSMAAALAILAAALIFMEGSLPGAAALVVAAAGLTLLAPAMKSLGSQSWGSIIKGLVALAGALVILGVASIVLAPVAPALLALGAAMLLIGGGLALAGVGISLIGAGLSAIAVSGPIALGIMVKALIDFAGALPKVVGSFVDGLIQIVTHIANAAPQFVTALGKILVALSKAVIAAAPNLANAFIALISAGLKVISTMAPQLISAGWDLLKALLRGVQNNIADVVRMAAGIITTILTTLASKAGSIVSAGAKALGSFLLGIANNVGQIIAAGVAIVVSVITGVGNSAGKLVKAGASAVSSFLSAFGDAANTIIKAGTTMIANVITGVGNDATKLVKSAANAVGKFINSVSNEAVKLIDEGAQAILNFLNGVDAAVKKYEPRIIAAGVNIGKDIIAGALQGLSGAAGQIVAKVEGIFGDALRAAKHKLGIHSPSTEFAEVGKFMMLGVVQGLNDNAISVNRSLGDTSDGMVDVMVKSLSKVPDMLDGLVNFDPTITPVLDLSSVKSGAQQMSDILAKTPVDAVASLGQASSISASQVAKQQEEAAPSSQPAPNISFEQNNYSPAALTPVEVYRQTKNQLSQLRKVVIPT